MNRKLSSTDAQKLEILKQYYYFDEETSLFHITLPYKSVGEIFHEKRDTLSGKRLMKDKVIKDICAILANIPKGYKAKFSVSIDDYEDMSEEQVMSAFNDILFLWHSRYLHTTKIRMVKAAFLILAGFALILIMVIGEIKDWWPPSGEVADRLLLYLLDCAGGVLIWEGIYFAFIERTPGLIDGNNLTTKLYSFGINGKDKEDMISTEVASMLVTKTNRFSSTCMMLAATGFFASTIASVLVSIPDIFLFIKYAHADPTTLAFAITFYGVVPNVIDIIVGIAALRLFFEDYSRWKVTLIFNPLLLVGYILRVLSVIFFYDWFENIISITLEAIVIIVYAIGFILIYHKRRKEKMNSESIIKK